MNCSTPDRPRHVQRSTVIRVEIVSNDPVDHLRTLAAPAGTNPQQTSRILRAPRVAVLMVRAARRRPLFQG